ncbi:MAG: hypothetical protein E7Z84_07380 [Methanosphaera stadtmanae]|nr:hypothetical protein [Methanosphaera stadtmanae]
MIITEDEVLLNLIKEDNSYYNLTFSEFESLLDEYKNVELKPREMLDIPDTKAYFSNDHNKHEFNCKIYKTMMGLDKWIMLMKDDVEGYALYLNPATNKYELAWYNVNLKEPISEDEEDKIRTCYVPI